LKAHVVQRLLAVPGQQERHALYAKAQEAARAIEISNSYSVLPGCGYQWLQ